VVLVLHPTGESDDVECARARTVLAVIREFRFELEIIGPNNDPGHAGILRAYRDAELPFHPSVDQDAFWHWVMNASALVGNSSAGIIEAASLGVPVVNIGDRQAGRERNPNVVDAPYASAALAAAFRKAILNPEFRKRAARRGNIYGDGKASRRIAAALEKLARKGPVSLAKRFADIPFPAR
jgi:UDP-N-acetylglucosamine 2-epimerase